MDIRPPISPQSTRFLDKLRNFIRLRGLAYKTETTYVFWIKRFIRFHGRKHPETMGTAEVEAARKPKKLPVVFSPDEARRVIACLEGEYKLIAMLLYGAGLRISKALRLRIKDIDFGMQQLIIREGKGGKDRITLLPDRVIEPLQKQIHSARLQHKVDIARGCGSVYMPAGLARKYPSASQEPDWQHVFPAPDLSIYAPSRSYSGIPMSAPPKFTPMLSVKAALVCAAPWTRPFNAYSDKPHPFSPP